MQGLAVDARDEEARRHRRPDPLVRIDQLHVLDGVVRAAEAAPLRDRGVLQAPPPPLGRAHVDGPGVRHRHAGRLLLRVPDHDPLQDRVGFHRNERRAVRVAPPPVRQEHALSVRALEEVRVQRPPAGRIGDVHRGELPHPHQAHGLRDGQIPVDPERAQAHQHRLAPEHPRGAQRALERICIAMAKKVRAPRYPTPARPPDVRTWNASVSSVTPSPSAP